MNVIKEDIINSEENKEFEQKWAELNISIKDTIESAERFKTWMNAVINIEW